MLSMPLSCCSMICVTEFSTVSAEAPVYWALMVTRGGAMSGYCSSGSVTMDKAPASMMTMAITHAKMGRWIKNCAMASVLRVGASGLGLGRCGWCRGRTADRRTQRSRCGLRIDLFHAARLAQVQHHGLHLVAGLDALKALHHHPLAGLQATLQQPVAAHGLSQLHRPLDDHLGVPL